MKYLVTKTVHKTLAGGGRVNGVRGGGLGVVGNPGSATALSTILLLINTTNVLKLCRCTSFLVS